jgi:hypothetical protein
MDTELSSQLLEETILLAEEEGATEECVKFKEYVCEMLPIEVLEQLEEINGGSAFLEDLWTERYERDIIRRANKAAALEEEELLEDGLCLICERKVRLTRHHVYPRETHKQLQKKGFDTDQLNTTIAICRMCHSTVHRFFSNNELAAKYNTVDMLLSDERMYKYAKWASAQSNGRYNKPL